jgi:catechol 2,3-dioxygenase-like lactoylglutathione lyase family enzyme
MAPRPRVVGVNHVALEVDDIGRALAFWRQLFDIRGVEREPGAAFIDLGDQFIALMEAGPHREDADRRRHFGLVVDDKEQTRRALQAAGAEILPGPGLDFRDPFGNRIQVVQYDQIQFSKTASVLSGMGLELGKTDQALAELRTKNLE